MTAVDRPDNGQDEGPWRVGSHYGIHVYKGGDPVATFLRPEDAARAVTAVNSARAGAGDQQREQVVLLLEMHGRKKAALCSCGWRDLTVPLSVSWERHVADELLALLGGPQPDGEVRQHRMDAGCWCGPVQANNGAWDHR